MPPGRGLQGTDLSDDHPISFRFTTDLAVENGELALPGSFSKELKLDKNGELQCTTCHDPHDSPFEKLLVVTNLRSQICIECHKTTGWQQSSHSQSEATWNKRPPNPWRDNQYDKVAENACGNCHISHTDDTTLVHDPAESAIVDTRHVECADCHDPHATRAGREAGDVPANVRGVNLAGGEIDEALRDYEICLRCHGDSEDKPRARTPRQHDQTNIRLEIQPNNPSFHPIAEQGRNENVPSLIFPLNEESIITCGSCHNSNSAESAGGSGPEGPHGSEYAPLLVRNYLAMDNTAESASAYALCYSCHSRDSILNDESFPEHNSHVVTEKTTCNACHDPHGISSTQGDELNNSHLINFDTSIVSSNSSGLLQFVDNGEQSGSCDLLCHGKEHNNLDYQN
jgi:predicted CXXCH cytochrome family protein